MVKVAGEAAEVARAEAQAVLAMVQDEERRGKLADLVAAVDEGEVEGADAAEDRNVGADHRRGGLVADRIADRRAGEREGVERDLGRGTLDSRAPLCERELGFGHGDFRS